VTVAAPDGRRVLPVFTSVATMAAWDPKARPVPADGIRTALAAAADDTDLIVIDPASETEFVLRRPAVWAIGQGLAWEPAHLRRRSMPACRLDRLRAGRARPVGGDGGIRRRVRGPELIVRLHLVDGLDQSELDDPAAPRALGGGRPHRGARRLADGQARPRLSAAPGLT
jgi:hypothetical protein